jgi:type VI secretion system secreted protein Hcp
MRAHLVRVVVAVAVLSLLFAAVPSDALAWRGLATITGQAQGAIQGDNTSKDGPGAVVVKEMGFQLNRPFDAASGLPTGQLRFAPFSLVKEPDRATPKLLRAAVTGERLTVEIKWFRSLATGVEQHYFTVRLENALVVSMDSQGDVTVAGGVMETLSLVYGKLVMTDVINGTMTDVTPGAP